MAAKSIHNLMQHFNLFDNDARSLALDRARNERIFQFSVIVHPISALCEPLLGKLDKTVSGDHGANTLAMHFQQARGNQTRN